MTAVTRPARGGVDACEMRRFSPVRRSFVALLTATLLAQLGCGTLLYPERHGLRGGRIDPAVLVLDGALLFVFLIPGIVAYAIDFHTGAIYLPSGRKVSVIQADPDALDATHIERLLREHTGVPIRLDDPRLESFRYESSQEALDALRRLAPA